MSCLAHVCATNTNQGLTTHELRAIVNFMVIRTLHRPFCYCQIHPATIEQESSKAVYDGHGLNLQYSQLWAFEDEDTAPVEMIVRYRLSQPVGLEASTLCVR
ncbi:hypothetical protein N7530_010521 [Penicillium desertorum]|uniref:Uncharacterized protein n=1 Tax=Penicillium desertorum TaxID=1303715 RepID=A0A9W9WHR5_9EURO|nr:hypothetical protein N7530_010521 [Penicillium desertorum]